VLLAMVAYFSTVVQAPITAFVIVLEMTDSSAMTVPLMAAALIGYGTSRVVGTPPVYHALARDFLQRHSASADG
jgi:H+/Cl- antiporter ClcA